MQRSRRLVLLLAATLGLGAVPLALSAAPGLPTTTAAAGSNTSTTVRVATFNVRTARALQDDRTWLERAPDVASEILSRDPGVVALQELGPGRADGQKGSLQGTQRQTTSLLSSLAALGGDRYSLVRTTPYAEPGTPHGTQGTRILYDTSRYSLESDCPETTGDRSYGFACAFDLPLAAGDPESRRRAAAYAAFRDRSSGDRFFVVSAHLDPRHSSSDTTEATYTSLRWEQAATVARTLAKVNDDGWPVVFGGDINSWQTDRGDYAPHRALVDEGFTDATSASSLVDLGYPTINHWTESMTKSKSGSGVRLDVVMAKGAERFTRYENVMAPVDPARPSDHNLVVADLVL